MTDEIIPSPIDAVAASTHHPIAFLSAENMLVLLTWTAFFLLLFVLNKFAWKPILAGLDQREELIRKSVEEAQQIKDELNKINQKRQQVLAEAEAKSKDIIDQSRKAALEAAGHITRKAKEESKILVENAQREIKEAIFAAQTQLKMTSANLAIDIAGKLIKENLDNEKNRKLIKELVQDL